MEAIKKNWPLLVCAALSSGAAFAGTDYQCLNDCTARYSRAYCLQVCEIRSPTPQQRYSSPVEAMIRGQQAAQEARAREAEIARQEAEAARAEVETQRVWEQAAREVATEKEKTRLQAENEALKQRLQDLEEQNAEPKATDCTAVPGPKGKLVFPCGMGLPRTQESLREP